MNNQDEVTRFTRVINERLNQMFSPRFEQIGEDRWKLTYYRAYLRPYHTLSVVMDFPQLKISEELEVIIVFPEHILMEVVVEFLNMIMKLGETWEHPIVVTHAK